MRRGKVYYDRDGTGHFFVNGVEVDQATYDAEFPSKFHQLLEGGGAAPATAHPAGWPMTSLSLSCHKSQVAEITARNERAGLTGVSYDQNGTCTVNSPRELAALHKVEGVHRNNKH